MDGRPLDADVIVVGGGPAGAATAIACAQEGLRVILCEREDGPRERPGETLHPGAEPLLRRLGVFDRLDDAVGARHAGTWIAWGGPPRFEAFGSDAGGAWSGWQVRRADFDAGLIDRARALGVSLRRPCRVTGLIREGDDLHGVLTQDGPIRARVVVDATGGRRWLGARLDIASPPRSPRLSARYGYRQGSCPARDAAPLLHGDASGWTWSARVRPMTYQWTAVRFGDRALGAVPDELRGLEPLGAERGADVTWRIAERTAGASWFMVGDAATILDPTSSHGVLKALLSGITAAPLIAAGVRRKAPGEAIAAAYHDWTQARFDIDAGHLRAFYRAIGAPGFESIPGAERDARRA